MESLRQGLVQIPDQCRTKPLSISLPYVYSWSRKRSLTPKCLTTVCPPLSLRWSSGSSGRRGQMLTSGCHSSWVNSPPLRDSNFWLTSHRDQWTRWVVIGRSGLGQKWVRGLGSQNLILKSDLKNSDLSHLGTIWPTLEPNLPSLKGINDRFTAFCSCIAIIARNQRC